MTRRRVTLADVARAAGVSRTTASLVLSDRGTELRISEASQQRVRQVASELGYRPNILSADLRRGSSRTIGFISDTIATSQLAGDMIKGALDHAHREGYLLFIGETEGDLAEEERLVQTMLDRQVDAVVIASMFTRERPIPEGVRGRSVVLLNALPDEAGAVTAIIPDEYDAGRRAAALLLAAGHTRIHLVGAGPARDQVAPQTVAGRERLAGILDALADAGIEPASGRMCKVWLPEDGWKATADLVASGARGDAIITFNDRLAFGAYQALQEVGMRVPDDFSLVSFDDHQLAGWLHPGLTTFAIPHYELGRRAIQYLLDEEDDAVAAVERIEMPLRLRGSVAPVGAVVTPDSVTPPERPRPSRAARPVAARASRGTGEK
ncbi:LacI family DNA-binding transcriptional regulator [Microbacterium sp. ET2]|uniref:LacI family DNA-binding transcriptional regulator n=1 Tax=Microbacterium albipurpureum TaxID=3050384 RepID=UPI00259CAD60|nr:LacI family DNA-binding transcriptional regulator [Microbacterium sp. ET2 (Ac-2212)]WJL96268.1 LacI family DNA-binding transcriptional regulator [Microbacterium sp. ET2 (Ac-2212)]